MGGVERVEGASEASLGAWRLVDDVGADRRGCRRCMVDRWLDTRRRTVSVQTESGDSVAMASD